MLSSLYPLGSLQRKSKSIVANGLRMEPETNFRITWHHGQVVLQAFNGRYLGTLPVGLVVASAAQPGEGNSLRAKLGHSGVGLDTLQGHEPAVGGVFLPPHAPMSPPEARSQDFRSQRGACVS